MVTRVFWRFISVACLCISATFSIIANAGGLVLAHSYPGGSLVDRWAQDFGDCTHKEGQVSLEIISGGALGGQREMVEKLVNGRLDMAIVSAWALERYWPALEAFSAPGLVENPFVLGEISNEPEIVARVEETLGARKPVSILGIGWRPAVLLSRDSVDSVAGLRVRSYGRAVGEILEKLGAKPMDIASYDVHSALAMGYAEGAFVNIEQADFLVKQGYAGSMFFEEDFSPFADAQMLVMGAGALELFGSELPERLRWECHSVSDAYNEESFRKLRELVEDAHSLGVDVVQFRQGSRNLWRDAIEETLDDVWTRNDSGWREIRRIFRDAEHR